MKTWVSYVLFIGIAIFTEVISGALTSGSMKTYELLQKPPLTPPGILFPLYGRCCTCLWASAPPGSIRPAPRKSDRR